VNGVAARLATLTVRDFRNLARVELTPPSDGVVVIGENGQGKTNLLEAIYYLQILRSIRGARDHDLVRFGAEAFHIAASVETDRAHDVGIGFERAGRRKRIRVDGVIPDRLSDGLGSLPSVMFSPADVDLVSGPPTARRRFLDITLALTARGYLSALQRYRAALLRRNAALRDAARRGRPVDAAITVWEPPLAEHGARLWSERKAWVESAAKTFEELCHAIGEAGKMALRYASTTSETAEPRASLESALAEKRPMDLRRGLTHAGPHRDDLVITLDGRDLRIFGSAGQQRTAAIALRMLEARTFRDRTGRAPVFLLDDPFAELDLRRATRVLELLEGSGLGQTLLAVPRESDIPPELTRLERVRIAHGELSAWSDA
jgi:DNA replication and repair protein RecF